MAWSAIHWRLRAAILVTLAGFLSLLTFTLDARRHSALAPDQDIRLGTLYLITSLLVDAGLYLDHRHDPNRTHP